MKKDLIIILYGSTGDLTFRKLLPALNDLSEKNIINEKTLIIAVGRRNFNTSQYIDFVHQQNKNLNITNIEKNITYYKMQITEEEQYQNFKIYLDQYINEQTQIIHYLAVAPELMLDIATNLSKNIISKNNLNHKLIFEKPFGKNYITARKANEHLYQNYSEKQIYRIDHYLGKVINKNILNLRFNNSLFTQLFNPKQISSFEIIAKEEDGILERGSFYDNVGATKDMFQSHMLQMVALLTMNKPKKMTSDYIIKEKIKVLKSLKFKNCVFGQYNGYIHEKNVDTNSLTDTLIQVDLYTNNKYKKIPIKVLTGKALDKKETYIKINYLDNSYVKINLFPIISLEIKTNLLNEEVNILKQFSLQEFEYSYLLEAAINSNKELFVSGEEIEAKWQLVDQILKSKKELIIYNKDYTL